MKAEKWYNYRYNKPDQRWAETLSEKQEKIPETMCEFRKILNHAANNHNPKLVASWMTGELKKILNYHDLNYSGFIQQLNPKQELMWHKWLEHFFNLLENDKLTDKNAEIVLRKMVADLQDPYTTAFKQDLFKEDLNLEKLVQEVIEENTEAVEDYRNGNQEALNHLTGQIMSKTNGKAEPQKTRSILQETV